MEVGDLIKIKTLNLEKIEYKDWYQHRNPLPGDIAQVVHYFDDEEPKVQIRCAPNSEDTGWEILIKVRHLEYE